MSTFDARVLAWANEAQVRRECKDELLQRSLKTIDDYKKFGGLEKGNVKVNYNLTGDIRKLQNRVQEDSHSYGCEGLDKEASPADKSTDEPDNGMGDIKVGFSFGLDVQEFPADDDDDEDENDKIGDTNDTDHEDKAEQMKGRPSRRKTVSSEVINLEEINNHTPPHHPKDKEAIAWLTASLEETYLFEHLETSELLTLIDALQQVDKSSGEALYTEGEEGDTFYIVQNGEVEISQNGQVLKRLGPGSCFGEEELMYSAESLVTVTAAADVRCWSLDRLTYRVIVTKASIKKRAMYEGFLSGIDFLENLTNFERMQVADALKPEEHVDGEKIIRFGQEGTHFYIIVSGTVNVIGRTNDEAEGEEVDVCTFTEGDCVGELEFINEHSTCADVIAVGPVKTAKMGRRHFEKVMGPVEEFLKDRAKDDSKFEYYRGKKLNN
eukprot:TRINITY_DN190_c1_g1_i1.p1 TRINITY_DN190_c1_g1~~TRINITY_DN190_c1_g1_i1.p1  ORF type:complete len:451 (+),score=105.13 TRINITY_DN190_c1_g1_i1:40-1353(+)